MNVIKKEYSAPEINYNEILRYMGVHKNASEFTNIIRSCLDECLSCLKYNVCYMVSDIISYENVVVINNKHIYSESLSKVLQNCNKAVVFSATIGINIDRLISKYSRLSPSKALCMQAIGSERIESLCNHFCNDIKTEFINVKQRYSPGYGDFSLTVQKDITSMLETPKTIGVTLNDSLIMSPSKSVTAIVGIERKK